MERIGIVGIGWRQSGPEGLARFTLAPDERARRLPEIARRIGARELVYLATCNRVEIAFAVERPARLGESGTLLRLGQASAGHGFASSPPHA